MEGNQQVDQGQRQVGVKAVGSSAQDPQAAGRLPATEVTDSSGEALRVEKIGPWFGDPSAEHPTAEGDYAPSAGQENKQVSGRVSKR